MKTTYTIANLHSLTEKEMQEIYAGESAWYWVAYGIGYGINATGEAWLAFWNHMKEHPDEYIA